MRTLLALSVAAAAAATGCKSDPKPTVATGGGGGTASAPATPARKGRPFDRATFEEVSQLPFGGAPTSVLDLTDDSLGLRITPAGEPQTAATIRLSRCLNCVAMDKAQWEPRIPELRQLLPKEVRDKPDTVFELGEVSVDGVAAIFTHQIAVEAVGGTDGQPLQRAMNTHAYTLYWNDGVNQVQVTAKDATMPDAPTVEQLAAKVPRAQLEALATTTFATILPYVRGK